MRPQEDHGAELEGVDGPHAHLLRGGGGGGGDWESGPGPDRTLGPNGMRRAARSGSSSGDGGGDGGGGGMQGSLLRT